MFERIILCSVILCLLKGSSADAVNDALEKLLRVAATASNNGAYSCQSHEERVEECSRNYPMQTLNRTDLHELQKFYLTEQLDASAVDKMLNEVFEKFTSDYSLDDSVRALLMFEKRIAAEAFDMCQNSTKPSFYGALLKATESGLIDDKNAPLTIVLKKTVNYLLATRCLCLTKANKSYQTRPREFLTATEAEMLQVNFEQLILTDSQRARKMVANFVEGRFTAEHFDGFYNMLDIIHLSGYDKYFGNNKTFGCMLAEKVKNGDLDVAKITALFAE